MPDHGFRHSYKIVNEPERWRVYCMLVFPMIHKKNSNRMLEKRKKCWERGAWTMYASKRGCVSVLRCATSAYRGEKPIPLNYNEDFHETS